MLRKKVLFRPCIKINKVYMSSFDTFCEDILDEMAAPPRKPRSIPPEISADKAPSLGKEKYGAQAGKYTGAQMLGFLGDYLKANADASMEYPALKSSIHTFLKNRGFGGTAANYWTRTLSQIIYDFGYEPESKSSATEGEGASPSEFPADEVPEISDSESGESPEAEPSSVEPEDEVPDQEPSNEDESSISDKDKEAVAELGLSPEMDDLLNVVKQLHAQSNSEVTNKQIMSNPDTSFSLRDDPSKLREALGKLAREGLLKRGNTGWFPVGKASAEDSEAVFDREEGGEDYGAIDTINKYASEFGDRPDWGSQFESHDITRVFIDTFKNKGSE
jgi:hypothetical protein